ncbi:MAG: hypothetical protein EGQ63_07200 [Clostridiales bacterium]|nr:hypothetical protein [Clostridiales bacterium]
MKKRIMYLGIFAALLVSALGMTAFAASSGHLDGGVSGLVYYATLKNTSGGSRYCSLYLYESGYNDGSNLQELGADRGVIRNEHYASISKHANLSYGFASGMVYKGTTAASGVGATYHKRLR